MRVLRAIGAALVLAVLVAGVPFVLVRMGEVGRLAVLLRPAAWLQATDARLVLGLVTVLAWAAWAVLVLSVVLELVNQLSRGRVRLRPRGLSWIQPFAGVLVAAVIAGAVAGGALGGASRTVPGPDRASAVVATHHRPDAGRTDDQRDRAREAAARAADSSATDAQAMTADGAPGVTHRVVEGDDLWTLAEQYYGDGTAWRQIVAANPGLSADAEPQPGTTVHIPRPLRAASGQPVIATAPQVGPRAATPLVARVAVPLPDDGERVEGQAANDRAVGPDQPSPEPRSPSVEPPAPGPDGSQHASGRLTDDPVRLALGSLTTMLAAAIGASLAIRWRERLDQRPVGRRLPPPAPESQQLHRAAVSAGAADPAMTHEATSAAPGEGAVIVGEVDGSAVLVDLAHHPRLCIVGSAPRSAELLGGIATSLASARWSERVRVIAVGEELAWVDELDHPQLVHEPELGVALERWFRLCAARAKAGPATDEPLDVLLVATALTATQRERLRAAQVPGTAVVRLGELEAGESTLTVLGEDAARFGDTVFAPQLVTTALRRALVDLHRVSGPGELLPAPWWAEDDPPAGSPPRISNRPVIPEREEDPMSQTVTHDGPPRLTVLGPVRLLGARGTVPSRAIKQCEEYCGWLLEHPGRSSATMVSSLLVAETTRRSNMSRLRRWLGDSERGEQYLPDAYTGRIVLHPEVTSDWEELQMLIAGGVNRTTNQALVDGLSLVRGAPLADAAPGQWHWAEAWRQDMISTIRDMAVVLAGRCLDNGNLDAARWALAKGRLVSPEDELLAGAAIRVEHAAGDHQLVDRLVMQLTRTARARGMDLLDETVVLIQEVVEGRSRSREA